MERTSSSTYDPTAPSEGAIELLLELGGLSLPMQGVACGLLAAECASNMLVRTLSGTRASGDGSTSPSWSNSRSRSKDGLRAPWDQLPEDLWRPIFEKAGFLQPTEAKMRCALSVENKTWNRVLNHPQLWQELELITRDFDSPAHFVDALLSCFRPGHQVRTLRIAQSPLLRDRPWECAHRVLYGRPLPHTLGVPASSRQGTHVLEKYLDDAYASAIAAGSPVPDRSDPAWAPVYKSLERMMQGCMYRHVFPGGEHMFTSFRRMMVRVWEAVVTLGLSGALLLAVAALYLLPGLRMALGSACLIWILAVGLHVTIDVASSLRCARSLPKLA